MTFLTQIASAFMNIFSLGGLFYNSGQWATIDSKYKWLEGVVSFIDTAFVPLMIIIGAVGGVWCIFLGVNLARAETADKAAEAKKRLINVVIAIVASALLVFLLSLFVSQVPNIFK